MLKPFPFNHQFSKSGVGITQLYLASYDFCHCGPLPPSKKLEIISYTCVGAKTNII